MPNQSKRANEAKTTPPSLRSRQRRGISEVSASPAIREVAQGEAMDHIPAIKNALVQVIALLDGLSAEARQSERITPEELKSQKALDAVRLKLPKKVAGARYLYLIELIDAPEEVWAEARRIFGQLKTEEGNKLSQVNDNHPLSPMLYVGSCQDMTNRFGSHLYTGKNETTRALRLSKWAHTLKCPIRITYYTFMDITQEQLQTIEDVAWELYKPMFGKKGGNGVTVTGRPAPC